MEENNNIHFDNFLFNLTSEVSDLIYRLSLLSLIFGGSFFIYYLIGGKNEKK